jgi:hypothetical protein
MLLLELEEQPAAKASISTPTFQPIAVIETLLLLRSWVRLVGALRPYQL